MKPLLRALIFLAVVPPTLAGCKQWVMKLPQAIHKYPFVRVTSVVLVNATQPPVPVANLKACHALCDKAGCKAFAFYYDQLLCSIAEAYQESGPRILTPDAVQRDQTLGFYVAAPHDQEKLPYCPSREEYGRYLHDSVRPWLFPEPPTTPALPIAASSSSSASYSSALPTSLKDSTTSGHTTSSSSTTTKPSSGVSPSTSTTTTSTSFAPSSPTTTTSGGNATSSNTIRSTTSTTTASTTQRSSGDSSSSQQTTPEKEPEVGSSKTTSGVTTESSSTSTTTSQSPRPTTTTSDVPSSVSTSNKAGSSKAESDSPVSTTTSERESTTTSVKKETKMCALAVNLEKYEWAQGEGLEGENAFKQASPNYIVYKTVRGCFINLSFVDDSAEIIQSKDWEGRTSGLRTTKKLKSARCECGSLPESSVEATTTTALEGLIYAGFVSIGDKHFDVACNGVFKEKYPGVEEILKEAEKLPFSVTVFPSCEVTLNLDGGAQLRYKNEETDGKLSQMEDVDTDGKRILYIWGRCSNKVVPDRANGW